MTTPSLLSTSGHRRRRASMATLRSGCSRQSLRWPPVSARRSATIVRAEVRTAPRQCPIGHPKRQSRLNFLRAHLGRPLAGAEPERQQVCHMWSRSEQEARGVSGLPRLASPTHPLLLLAAQAPGCSPLWHPRCAGRRCDGEGRIIGGLGAVPGFGWWPIKAYRPCNMLGEAGVEYVR